MTTNALILIGFILAIVACAGYILWRRAEDKREDAEYKRQSEAMIEADRKAREAWAVANPGQPYPGDADKE